MSFPNLAGVATQDLVETIGTNKFKASYINWSRTMHLLRTQAPGWLPYLKKSADGSEVHRSAIGAYLMIGFEHYDGKKTPPVPQAIMDHSNNSVPFDKITARDVTDTHRRGVCMAAALTFGLAYELWAKMPLESGYAPEPETKPEQAVPAGKPQDGMRMQDFPPDRQQEISAWARSIQKAWNDGDPPLSLKLWDECDLPHEEKAAAWFELDSKTKTWIRGRKAA